MAICGQLASAKEYAYDAMAAERILKSSLKLLAFLFTVVFIIQDNIIIFKKQDPSVPQTVSTSLEVLGLASHSTLRPNGRFKSRTRRFLALRVQYTVKEKSSFKLQRNSMVWGDISSNRGPKRTKISPKYPRGEGCNES